MMPSVDQAVGNDPPDSTMLRKFDCKIANQYAYEKKWGELKDYMWQFFVEDSEDVVCQSVVSECKVLDLLMEGKYTSASSYLGDDIIPALKASNVGTLAEHLYYLHGVVNTSMTCVDESGATKKLAPVRIPRTSKFDPMIANVYVFENKWDGLVGYLRQFGSEESGQSLKLLVQSECHAIKLIQEEKATEALSAIKDLASKLVETPCNETTRFMDHLVFFQESLCIFEEEEFKSLFNRNDVDGVKDYLDGFLNNLPHGGVVDRHPILELIILELKLALASEEENLVKSKEILKLVDELKMVPADSPFRPLDMHARIKKVKYGKKFDDTFKEGRMEAILDYIRLYFRKHFRPMLGYDDTFLKFCVKLQSGKLKCLACGYNYEKNRGETCIEDHITRSDKAKARKMNMCDAVTPRLKELAEECRAHKSCPSSQKRERSSKTEWKRKRSSKTSDGDETESRKMTDDTTDADADLSRSKSRKMSAETEVSGSMKPTRAMPNPEDIPGDDPVSLISKIYMKMADFGRAKISDLSGIAAYTEARSSILKLQDLILLVGPNPDSVLDEVLKEIGKLEKAAQTITGVDLPEVLVPIIMDFIALVFKLRYSCLKTTSLDSPPETPTLFHQATEMMRLCLDLSNMIAVSATPLTPTGTKVLKEFQEKVVELLRSLMGQVDIKQVFPLLSSLHCLVNKIL